MVGLVGIKGLGEEGGTFADKILIFQPRLGDRVPVTKNKGMTAFSSSAFLSI